MKPVVQDGWRLRVLAALCESASTSAEVAAATGLGRTTVCLTLALLCGRKLVENVGRANGAPHYLITERGFDHLQSRTPA